MTDYLDLIDPELREAALIMRQMTAEYTPMNRRKLARRRQWMADNAQLPFEDVPYLTRSLPQRGGPDVTVYVVNPKPERNGPGILHIHGGGFTASTALGGMRNVQTLAKTLDCPIVTVEYRLAPEAVWSESLEDNYTALLWLVRNGGEIGIDPARIALLGESAGGGHAALLTLAARDRGEVTIAFQALIYPMLDDRSGTSRKVPEHIGYFGWNPEANRFGWESFLGRKPGTRNVPPEAVPARAQDLSGLPPAFIGVGALDLFVVENIDYAGRLLAARVPTELLVLPGGFHGFDMFVPDAALSRRLTGAKVAALRRGLGISANGAAGED